MGGGGLLESKDDGDVSPSTLGEDPFLMILVNFHTHIHGFYGGKAC